MALESRNRLFIFLQGSPDASIRVEVRKKGATPENHQPVASDQSVTTDEDTPVAIRLAASDADGDPLAYQVLNAPRWGALSGAPPDLSYMPSENFHGTDSFTFKVNDGLMDSEQATVHITVNPVNDAPIADAGMDQAAYVGDTVALNGDQSRDVEGDPLTFQWFFVSWPGEGPPALLDSDTTQPKFIPYFPGTYQIRLIVNDGNTESSSETTITVGYEPFSLGRTKIMAGDGQAGDHFGASVAVSGNYALVGAPGKGSGRVHVFAWDGSTWTEEPSLLAVEGEEGDHFGTSVSISGSRAIVGANGDGDNGTESGAAYIFEHHSPWTEAAKLTAGGGSGAIYVFRRDGRNWVEKKQVAAQEHEMGFGASVAMEGDKIMVGAEGDESFLGSASIQTIESYHTVSISAFPEALPLGQSAALEWSSIHGITASIDSGIGEVPLNGSLVVTPSQTTTYTITLSSRFGEDLDYITLCVNQPPFIQLIKPDGVTERVHNRFTIQWTDDDTEEDAEIPLYYDSDGSGADGVLIVNGLREDVDGWGKDTYVWDTSDVPDGSYFIYAVIDDGFNAPVVAYSAGVVVVDHSLYSGSKVGFSSEGYGADIGSSVSIDGEYAIVGAPSDSSWPKSSNGSAYILQWRNGIWTERAKLTASDGEDWEYFGRSVAISGEYAVVGAHGDSDHGSSSGAAYIFRRENSTWRELIKLAPNDLGFQSSFGWSVSIDGDYAAIGAPGAGSGAYYRAGAVYVFKNNGSSWVQEDKLLAANRSGYDLFGVSVCINGEYVIVGANGDSDIAKGGGSAYIFKREGAGWTEQAKLVPNHVGVADGFGSSVSIDDDYAVVGAPHQNWYGTDNASKPGSAYVFKREGEAWVEQAELSPINGTGDDYFGNSVSISGDYVLVGAEWAHQRYDGHRTGSAYLFRRDGFLWKEFVELIPTPGSYYEMSGPWFGSSVALNGADILVGALSTYPSGAVYAYSLIPLSIKASAETILLGGSATLSWNCSDSTSVRINNGIGVVPAQGSITITPNETTTYSITADGPWGTYTRSITVTVFPLLVSIDSPWEGATVSKAEVTVEGTITDAPGFEIGVNVNGVVAMVEGNRFVASHVPLLDGQNMITATAVDTFGHTASASITIYADTSGDYVRIKAEPESGISPLESTLRIDASFNCSNPSLAYTGPGSVDFVSNPTSSEYQVRINSPGLYAFTIEVADDEGKGYTDTVTLQVMDLAALDLLLRAKWNGLRDALGDSNIPKAMEYIAQGAKNMYQFNFELMNAYLGEIAAGLQDISIIKVRDQRAEFEMWAQEDGQMYSFYILFSKDRDGIWRISFF